MIEQVIAEISTSEARYMDVDNDLVIEFLEALEYSLVKRNSLSVPFWSNKIGAERLNRILYVLGNHNLVKTEVKKKYAAITATDSLSALVEDVLDYRVSTKIRRYGMKCTNDIQAADLVSTPSGIKPTGIVRHGFAYSANQKFKLDISYLVKYYDAILKNTTKSIMKTMVDYSDIAMDEANYKEMCDVVLSNYIDNPHNSYNLEHNISDQRGRSIYNGIKRVFNPISSKDCRSMLVAPYVIVRKDDSKALRDIYLFIAELNGSKADTVTKKELAGRAAYNRRSLPDLDLTIDHDRKELHELIWLDRIYSKLDELQAKPKVKWDIPLEMDASMSLAQVEGALLDSQELLVRTNAVGDKLQDPWHIGLDRLAAKTVGTPTFYGSKQSPRKLLASKGIELSKDDMKLMKKEFSNGDFSIIKDFKDLLIDNMKVDTPTYQVQGWNETYTVEVNKRKAVGASLNAYKVWDTEKKRDKVFFLHEPTTVPDYLRFKTFAATGLVHNVESKGFDNVLVDLKNAKEWAISIHDAILCMPGSIARSSYTKHLEELNLVGRVVLSSYMLSIGAVSTKAKVQLTKLLDKVTENKLKFSENALK